MADNTNFRSYRPADQRWPAQGNQPVGREGGHERNDPLAELARLIGQTDPFAELNKGAPAAQNAHGTQGAHRGHGAHGVHSAPAVQGAAAPQAKAAQVPPSRPAQPADPYGSPLGGYGQMQAPDFQPAYDPAIYGSPQTDAGYPAEAYYDDPARPPQGEEVYADYGEERPRRGLMKLAVVAGALVIIGAGGVFGYRAIFGGGPSGPPPVIKANTAPSKMAPAPGSGSNKQIVDRVGDNPQGERLVSREEKPVEINTRQPAARVILPAAPGASSDSAMVGSSPPLPTDPGGPSAAEPKKIKTVTIRPDQVSNTAAAAARPAASPQARNNAAPPPVASAPATVAADAPRGVAPLSLSPQVASAGPTAPQSLAAAPAGPTRLAAAPADVPAGSYTVQISSQRSENEAQASFRSLQAKYPTLLGDRQPLIRRADLGDKGIYFRTMVGPFASAEQASQFCGSLKSAGGQCVVQRN